jgi:hypothetical protein
MSPAVELAQHLAAEGVTAAFGGSAAFSVHVSREPVEPSDAVTLYDTTGRDLIDVEEQFRRPGIQVRTRSLDYQDGYAMQQAIFEELALPTSRQIGAHWYVSIGLVGDILSIGRDDRDRFLLTANYQIERQPA